MPPPSGKLLRLETKTERFVCTCFQRERPPSIILTGNAGDGKTYLCHQIIEAFTSQPVTDRSDRLEWPIERDGLTLRVVKDLSEMDREASAAVLRDLVDGFGFHDCPVPISKEMNSPSSPPSRETSLLRERSPATTLPSASTPTRSP